MYNIANLTYNCNFKIDYTNYKGERSVRTIRPICIWFGSTEYHKEPQFLLNALDVDKNEERDFAMKDIHDLELDNQDGYYNPLSLQEDYIFPYPSNSGATVEGDNVIILDREELLKQLTRTLLPDTIEPSNEKQE
jgi:predicted DNA-binding transcriptional regulator YafY